MRGMLATLATGTARPGRRLLHDHSDCRRVPMTGLMRPRFRGARPNAKGEDASEASARSPERRPCAGGRRRLLIYQHASRNADQHIADVLAGHIEAEGEPGDDAAPGLGPRA